MIGLIISGSLLAMWLNLQSKTLLALQQSRLHQDLRAINHVMVHDIRRAGYWAWTPASPLALTQNPFMTADNDLQINQASATESSDSCLTYSYDRNHDGLIGDGNVEQFGFRLHDQAIEMRTGGSVFNCHAGNWQDITQAGTVITILTFTLENAAIFPPAGCLSGQACQTQRRINIRLRGHHQSRPELAITLEEQIRIRNDHLAQQS